MYIVVYADKMSILSEMMSQSTDCCETYVSLLM